MMTSAPAAVALVVMSSTLSTFTYVIHTEGAPRSVKSGGCADSPAIRRPLSVAIQ
jgi:hypothetical protein